MFNKHSCSESPNFYNAELFLTADEEGVLLPVDKGVF